MDYSNKNNQSNSSISSNCSTSSDSRNNQNGNAMKRTNKYIDLQHQQVLGNYKNGSSSQNNHNYSSNCNSSIGNYNISGIRMGTMSELWK